jgi:hypothetical protein
LPSKLPPGVNRQGENPTDGSHLSVLVFEAAWRAVPRCAPDMQPGGPDIRWVGGPGSGLGCNESCSRSQGLNPGLPTQFQVNLNAINVDQIGA